MSGSSQAPRRSFMQRVTGGTGGAGAGSSTAAAAAGASTSSASASAGKVSPLNPFDDADDDDGDNANGDDRSGGEDDEEEDGLSEHTVALAARDFTSMRLSVAGAPGASSVSAGAGSVAGVASREELRVHASIISADTTKEAKGDSEFVCYRIAVSTGSTAGLSWKVGRRFREFEALHAALCTRFGKDHLPPLPKKALRRSLDPEYVRKKKTELAKYLADLMLDPGVAESEPLAHFLVSSLQDVVRGSVDNLRVFAARGVQLKSLEQQMQRCALDRSRMDRATLDAARDADELKQRAMAAEAAAAESNAALLALQTEWEARYNELAAHAKLAVKEKKQALKFVQDLDLQTRRLKAEKKILVSEVKANRARMAALGALGTAAGGGDNAAALAALTAGMESSGVSGYSTPATGAGAGPPGGVISMASSPQSSPSPSAVSLAALQENSDDGSTGAFHFQLSSSAQSPSPTSSPSARAQAAELDADVDATVPASAASAAVGSSRPLVGPLISPSSTGDSIQGDVDAMLNDMTAAAASGGEEEEAALTDGGAALSSSPQ